MNKQAGMYYIMFEAKPLPDNAESKDYGGVYINWWINSEDSNFAMNRAKNYITNEEWEMTKVEDCLLLIVKDMKMSQNRSNVLMKP